MDVRSVPPSNTKFHRGNMSRSISAATGQPSGDRQITDERHPELSLQVFIISWTGQHENAALIERCCLPDFPVSVIYSDRDDRIVPNAEWIRVTDNYFAGYKFSRALTEFDGDIMCIITADARYCNWSSLLKNCKRAFTLYGELGVWSPDVDFSPLNQNWNVLVEVEGTDFIKVVQTDSIVWAFSRAVADRLRSLDLRLNNLGWGIDIVASAHCHSTAKLVLVDKSIRVFHPRGTGYSVGEAGRQCVDFLRQMSEAELIAWTQKATYQHLYPRAGKRNDLCLCKSGLRYKHCHGRYHYYLG
jgi:SEC-C motif